MARKKNNGKHALLIYPRTPGTVTSNDVTFPFPFLGLTQVAAAFPEHYTVRIIDERIRRVRGTEPADIVFISALTSSALRAYALADMFRKRGIPVVLGGVHATVLPDEAARHATTVVIGEAEDILGGLLADFDSGALAKRYQSPAPPDLDTIPAPRLRLLSWRHRLYLAAIQTSRGCPHRCDFCSVPVISGSRLRQKSLATVERELQELSRLRTRNLFVVDDNFTATKERTLAIVELFRYYGYRWTGFSTLPASEDEDFLRALHDGGCTSLFVGFESLYGQAGVSKNRRYETPDQIRAAVNRIHRHGIGIQGSFIFGFDGHTEEIFQETAAFIQEAGIYLPTISLLTPLPGTAFFDVFDRESRLLHKNWNEYDMNHVVIEPRQMRAEILQQGYAWALKYLASPTSIIARLRRGVGFRKDFLIANFALHNGQTRLAHSLWNKNAQRRLREKGLCPC